jgi:hypothetical protein
MENFEAFDPNPAAKPNPSEERNFVTLQTGGSLYLSSEVSKKLPPGRNVEVYFDKGRKVLKLVFLEESSPKSFPVRMYGTTMVASIRSALNHWKLVPPSKERYLCNIQKNEMIVDLSNPLPDVYELLNKENPDREETLSIKDHSATVLSSKELEFSDVTLKKVIPPKKKDGPHTPIRKDRPYNLFMRLIQEILDEKVVSIAPKDTKIGTPHFGVVGFEMGEYLVAISQKDLFYFLRSWTELHHLKMSYSEAELILQLNKDGYLARTSGGNHTVSVEFPWNGKKGWALIFYHEDIFDEL